MDVNLKISSADIYVRKLDYSTVGSFSAHPFQAEQTSEGMLIQLYHSIQQQIKNKLGTQDIYFRYLDRPWDAH